MAPGVRNKYGAPMFEPEVFRKQIYCFEDSTCDVVRTFPRAPAFIQRPHSDSGPGELCPS